MTELDPYSWGRGDTRRIATRDFPSAVVALVTERQGGRYCSWCVVVGRNPPDDEPLELDHRQPLSMGGDNHHLNLQWACRSCNRSRGDRRAPPPGPPKWQRRRRL